MSNSHEKHRREPQISILTEAKLLLNSDRKLVTIKKRTNRYVDEIWLKFMKESELLEYYEFERDGDETRIKLIFAVDDADSKDENLSAEEIYK